MLCAVWSDTVNIAGFLHLTHSPYANLQPACRILCLCVCVRSFFESCRPSSAVSSSSYSTSSSSTYSYYYAPVQYIPFLGYLLSALAAYIPSSASVSFCRAVVCLRRACTLLALGIAQHKCSGPHLAGRLLNLVFAALALRTVAGRWLPVGAVAPAVWLIPPALLPRLVVQILQLSSSAPRWRAGRLISFRPLLVHAILPVVCVLLSIWCGLRMGCPVGDDGDDHLTVEQNSSPFALHRSQCAHRIWAALQEHAAEIWSHL